MDPANDGAAREVRAFRYRDDEQEFPGVGTWLGATADSTGDLEGDTWRGTHSILIEGHHELARLRGRVERRGVEIQESAVLELTETTERATVFDDYRSEFSFD